MAKWIYDDINSEITIKIEWLFLLFFRLKGMGLGMLRSLCNEKEKEFLDFVVNKGREIHPLGIDGIKDENDLEG